MTPISCLMPKVIAGEELLDLPLGKHHFVCERFLLSSECATSILASSHKKLKRWQRSTDRSLWMTCCLKMKKSSKLTVIFLHLRNILCDSLHALRVCTLYMSK